MAYSFVPKEKYAKASGRNIGISTKSAGVLCKVIRKKPLKRARRLLDDLVEGRRNLRGKYYTNAAKEILNLIESCEKNAEFIGLDNERLTVSVTANMGSVVRRRRRKRGYGTRMKSTNVDVYLIESGKPNKDKPKKHIIMENKS